MASRGRSHSVGGRGPSSPHRFIEATEATFGTAFTAGGATTGATSGTTDADGLAMNLGAMLGFGLDVTEDVGVGTGGCTTYLPTG